jgi:hypothetical protein
MANRGVRQWLEKLQKKTNQYNRNLEAQMNNLIKIATVLALAAVASGNLPTVLFYVKKAQLQLIQDSKASKWPKVMTLPENRKD